MHDFLVALIFVAMVLSPAVSAWNVTMESRRKA
jgi:hypothetical protein